jgi:hypothetical protein
MSLTKGGAKMRWRFLYRVAVLILGALAPGFIASSREPAAQESTRSAPPDATRYVRPAVPEDSAPRGKPAIGPKVALQRKGHRRQASRRTRIQGRKVKERRQVGRVE